MAGTRPHVSAHGDVQVMGVGAECEEVLSGAADTCRTGTFPQSHSNPMLRPDSGTEQLCSGSCDGAAAQQQRQELQDAAGACSGGPPRLSVTGLASPSAGARPGTPCPGSNPTAGSTPRSRAADSVLLAVSCTLRASDLPVRKGSRGARVLTAEELRRKLLTDEGSLATRAVLAKHAGAGRGARQVIGMLGGKARVAAEGGAVAGRASARGAQGVKERRACPPIREDEGSDGGNGATDEATDGRSGRVRACGLCAIM